MDVERIRAWLCGELSLEPETNDTIVHGIWGMIRYDAIPKPYDVM